MKTVLLMRHAEASEATSGVTDFDRTLTREGIDVARKTGELLGSMKVRIDRVICSSAMRTHQTAMLVAAPVCPSAPLVPLPQLYNASGDRFASSLSEQMFDDELSAMIIGHNPGIASLMSGWAEQRLAVSPATLTIFQFAHSDWSAIGKARSSKPVLHAIIQDGEFVWKAPSFADSDGAAD